MISSVSSTRAMWNHNLIYVFNAGSVWKPWIMLLVYAAELESVLIIILVDGHGDLESTKVPHSMSEVLAIMMKSGTWHMKGLIHGTGFLPVPRLIMVI